MALTKHIIKEVSEQKLKILREKFDKTGHSSLAFDALVQADPTPNGTYLNWLFSLFFRVPSWYTAHTVYKVKPSLYFLFTYKDKLKKMGVNPDINSYKSIDELIEVMEPHMETIENKRITKVKDASKLYEDEEWLLLIPKTEEASCTYGKGTKWCTSADESHNTFNNYKERGFLYILINKKTNDKWQWHYGQSEFKDSGNNAEDPESVISQTPMKIQQIFDMDLWNNKIQRTLRGYEESGNYKNGVLKGDLYIAGAKLKVLDGLPKIVHGNVTVSYNELTTLEGAPEHVGGNFHCSECDLKSLKGAPEQVGMDFFCEENQLTTLEGAPKFVGGDFKCYGNQLTSLMGAPEQVGGYFQCTSNKLLTSLEGAPKHVGGMFYCRNNPNLSREEILKYKQTGAVKGVISSDYDDID